MIKKIFPHTIINYPYFEIRKASRLDDYNPHAKIRFAILIMKTKRYVNKLAHVPRG